MFAIFDVRNLRAGSWLLAIAFGVLSAPSNSSALTCPGVNELVANETLEGDYTTNSATVPCFIVPSGFDLDLAGYSITCTNGTGCAAAIEVEQSGTVVEDSANGTTGISGPFAVGVNNAQTVRDVRIDGASVGIKGLSYANQIYRNVITNVDTCINVALDSNTDYVRDNFCETAPGGIGIEASGTATGNGPKVETNYVRNYGASGAYRAQNTQKLQLLNNIAADAGSGGDPFSVNTTGKTITGNVCDVTDANCPRPFPFVFP